MKLLYITDLHGDKNKYEKVLEIADRENIRIIVNGGDILPKKGERHKIQPVFLNGYLPEYFNRLENKKIDYVVMLGNDDLEMYDTDFEKLCSDYSYIHNVGNTGKKVGNYEFIGMNYILDTPFPRKVRIINEEGFIPEEQLSSTILKPEGDGYRIVENWDKEREELPKMIDKLRSLPEAENPDKTIYLIHEPPANLDLGRVNTFRDIGSNDVVEFLSEVQPLFSFHGHIHESPLVGGRYFNRIGNTICIQPGQTEFGESELYYVILDLKTGEFERYVEKV